MPVRCTVTDPASANYLKDCSSKRCTGTGTVNGIAVAANFAACSTDAECVATLGATGGTCTAGLPTTTPGCTAGFVVSLSEPDNTVVTDITLTIAARALADGASVGYAGREAIRKAPVSGTPAFGPTINTNTPSNDNVRQDKYLMSRRLWLNDTCNQNDLAIPTCAAGAVGPGCDTTGVTGRDAAECLFFGWATDGLPLVSLKAGRENMDPIMVKWGFIPCTDTFGQPTGDGNLCSKSYSATGFPVGNGAPNKCVANTITAGAYVATANATADICCSDGLPGNSTSHVPANTCPVPAKRPTGAACRFDVDCVATCDVFGTATTGTCL
jgi:hypothetical protein